MDTPSEDAELVYTVKALATLVALHEYAGDKTSHTALIHAVAAVDELIAVWRKRAESPPSDEDNLPPLAHLSLWLAAESLGLNPKRTPQFPSDESIEVFYHGLERPSDS